MGLTLFLSDSHHDRAIVDGLTDLLAEFFGGKRKRRRDVAILGVDGGLIASWCEYWTTESLGPSDPAESSEGS